MKHAFFTLTVAVFVGGIALEGLAEAVKVGAYAQEVHTAYTTKDGLPGDDVNAVAVTATGDVYAGTMAGLAAFQGGRWTKVELGVEDPVWFLASKKDMLAAYVAKDHDGRAQGGTVYILSPGNEPRAIPLPQTCSVSVQGGGMAFGDQVLLCGAPGLFTVNPDDGKTISLPFPQALIRQIAVGPQGELCAATDTALLSYDTKDGAWRTLYPADGVRSWAPIDVRGAAFDRKGRLWFASPQGVACRDRAWTLFTGQEGLPYNDFTTAAGGEDGVVWFGTHKGAIRFDGTTWEYRQGRRWLIDDDVRAIAVSANGDAWFATSKGVSVIERRPMTLAEKAKWYEDEIDRYHRRTPYGYVLEVSLAGPGDKTEVTQHDSDNDGLWTSMYGAGECFAYGATKDPKAKERAKKAFNALKFLGEVTQGGTNPAPPGFVARTILPTSGPNPNEGRVEADRREQQEGDKLWKVIDPRWPISADGKWYWKSDTSSDELDGHYFFYALYYDLVADTEEEKTRVREHVRALTDHLVDHNFQLVDHDGKPTRWARYSPEELNHDVSWFAERGLNSLSMLSYLAVAEHLTGDSKYRETADHLIEEHSYLQNMQNMKYQRGAGTGNQSDDEMALMSYYTLLKYEKDPVRRSRYALSFWMFWRIEQPEMNPLFDFAFAALCTGATVTDAWGEYPLSPAGDWIEDSVDTLKRFPLDRVDWRHENSHRIDIRPSEEWKRSFDEGSLKDQGCRVNGKVLPVDERHFNHWNHSPWELNTGGNGRELSTGAVFLLPYYMGLYHGFITD